MSIYNTANNTSFLTMWSLWLLVPILIPILYYSFKHPSVPTIPTATPNFPIIGSALSFNSDPIKFLLEQRARHGDVFLVNLSIIRIVFFLGPESVNTILKGTEKSGISFWAMLTFMIGGAVKIGFSVEGWPEAGQRTVRKILSLPEMLTYWNQVTRSTTREWFNRWAETGDEFPLFRGLALLSMTSLVHFVLGRRFTEKHGEEVVDMVQKYETYLQKPQVRSLPRWMSKEGRFLDAVEARMKILIDEEISHRLTNFSKYKSHTDYLQMLLNEFGDKFVEAYPMHILGILHGAHTNGTTTFAWSLLHVQKSSLLSTLRKQNSKALLEAVFRETGRLYTNLVMLRRITVSQVIMGKSIPQGTFVACSPLVTARDPSLFLDPHKFRPERWLTNMQELDEAKLKDVERSGASVQFGKGLHSCMGEKMGREIVMDTLWGTLLGNDEEPGFEIDILSGVKECGGVDNVGVEAAWTEENLGTPFQKGDPVMVRFRKRTACSGE